MKMLRIYQTPDAAQCNWLILTDREIHKLLQLFYKLPKTRQKFPGSCSVFLEKLLKNCPYLREKRAKL